MADYKELPQSEEHAALPVGTTDETIRAADTHYSKFIRAFVHLLLAVNAILLVANGSASLSIRTSLAKVLPVHDPRSLPQPDQYAGLPETSRNKTIVLRDENGNLVYPDAQTGKRSTVPGAAGPYHV
ncbi:hypothetical protein PENSPDRAFT_686840 [Peniophora sp. CONT]|nr:hypothetical protein PENSPDRAFT_686840 [Peniophora sp. CONT]